MYFRLRVTSNLSPKSIFSVLTKSKAIKLSACVSVEHSNYLDELVKVVAIDRNNTGPETSYNIHINH